MCARLLVCVCEKVDDMYVFCNTKIYAVKGLKLCSAKHWRFAQPSSKRGKDSKDWEGAGLGRVCVCFKALH